MKRRLKMAVLGFLTAITAVVGLTVAADAAHAGEAKNDHGTWIGNYNESLIP